MTERLPERVRTAAVARAVTSPSAMLLAGAGASAAILTGLPLAAAAAVGALAWAGRVALAVPRRPRGERIDPSRVREPWRRFMVEALQAQARFDRTVGQAAPGPVRDRLTAVGRRISDGVEECWRIARQGNLLEDALRQLDVAGIQRELSEVVEERRRQPPGSASEASLARTQQAVEAQLASSRRIHAVWSDARDRIRLLNAQLDEAVARAVELSLQTGDASRLSPLTDDVDHLVAEMESLRQGLEEAGGGSGAGGAGHFGSRQRPA